MIDAEARHAVLADPPQDLPVRGVEDRRILDAYAGQAAYREEPSVALVHIRASPADQFVVLPLVDGPGAFARTRPGARCDREPVLVVAQLTIDHAQGRKRLLIVAEDRQPDATACPIDVE